MLVLNATDAACMRSPAACLVDRSFPAVPITYRPDPIFPDPILSVEVAEDFSQLSEIVNSAELIGGPDISMDRVLRQLAVELGLVLSGPPTDIPIGRGHPPLTEPLAQSEFTVLGFPRPQLRGDFDQDGVLTAADLDQLTLQVIRGGEESVYDLTENGLVNDEDRLFWLVGLSGTPIGDANMDGHFDSGDLIVVLAAGEYEDRIALNSRWATGDFNGDFEFDTGDLILALEAGAYESGRAAGLPVLPVPEPAAGVLLSAGLLGLAALRTRQEIILAVAVPADAIMMDLRTMLLNMQAARVSRVVGECRALLPPNDFPDLIERARHDRSCLGQLMEQYRNYLVVLTRSRIPPMIRGRFDASDVVQETLLEVHRDFHAFRGSNEAELLTWLRRTLARNLTDQMRYHGAARRDAHREAQEVTNQLGRTNTRLADFLADGHSSPSQHVSRREQAVILADAIARLPDDHRDVIIQRNLQQRSFVDIAVDMQRTPDAVRMLWVRAIENLKLDMT